MERIVTIKKDDVVYALFFHGVSASGGARFLTEPTEEFQAGVMERAKGYKVEPHTHPREQRTIERYSEFLYIEKGSIRVTVYDDAWKVLGEETLSRGDFLLFFRGGHGIEMLEDSRIIEVKQGPYPGADNAKLFRPAT
jgi:quercetin dioxygenase-like cupin family protein